MSHRRRATFAVAVLARSRLASLLQGADAAHATALGSFPTVGAARAATAGLPLRRRSGHGSDIASTAGDIRRGCVGAVATCVAPTGGRRRLRGSAGFVSDCRSCASCDRGAAGCGAAPDASRISYRRRAKFAVAVLARSRLASLLQEADAAYAAALGSFPTVGAARTATAGLPVAAPLRTRVGCHIGGGRHSPWLCWRGRDLRRSYRGQTPLTPPRWVRFRL